MSRAQDMWIHQQLEPTDIIITGNRKRYREIRKELVMTSDKDIRSLVQKERDEDDFLAAHGVNIKLKQPL